MEFPMDFNMTQADGSMTVEDVEYQWVPHVISCAVSLDIAIRDLRIWM